MKTEKQSNEEKFVGSLKGLLNLEDLESQVSELKDQVEEIDDTLNNELGEKIEEGIDAYFCSNDITASSIAALSENLSTLSAKVGLLDQRLVKIERFIERAETVSQFLADAKLFNQDKR